VCIGGCDCHTLFILIQTMLRKIHIRNVEINFFQEDDPIESVSEWVVAPLQNGLGWTSALKGLSIHCMCLATDHDTHILAEGLRHCSSLKSLAISDMGPSTQVVHWRLVKALARMRPSSPLHYIC
jgi:hypothetical protein